MSRIMICAPASGGGKTTITCALLGALRGRGLDIISYKCGPDFIDPMFHKEILNTPSRNLDYFFSGENGIKNLLSEVPQDTFAVIEGVMGIYDGISAGSDIASSWHIADITDTPIILVLPMRGMALTAAAIVNGLKNFKYNSHIMGIILNDCSENLYKSVADVLESKTGLQVLGYMPMVASARLYSRHLGLITADEQENLPSKLGELTKQFEKSVDIDKILKIAEFAPKIEKSATISIKKIVSDKIKIAVARDKAFCFYYDENLRILEKLGAEIVYFSPLEDVCLPRGVSGLYFGGGYPEIFAHSLSQNSELMTEIKNSIENAVPTIAECGGFLYLHEQLQGQDEKYYPAVGVVPGSAYKTEKLVRFGYAELTSISDGLLPMGEKIRCHEFHYYDSENPGNCCKAKKPVSEKNWECVHQNRNLFAGFPHLYFGSNINFAENFLKSAEIFAKTR